MLYNIIFGQTLYIAVNIFLIDPAGSAIELFYKTINKKGDII
jgi:hypothetical protein